MILLTLETEHFFFQALDATKEDAFSNLVMALNYHGEAMGLRSGWYRDYDIEETWLEPGSAYRDKQLLYRRPS